MNVNINRRALRETTSVLRYETVSTLPYTTDVPFKGIHVEAAGNITIVGVDNVQITLSLTPGCWPYGGIGIASGGTTLTPIKLLF